MARSRTTRTQGVPASPSGLRPFGVESQAPQAEPLVPNAVAERVWAVCQKHAADIRIDFLCELAVALGLTLRVTVIDKTETASGTL